LKPNFLVIGAQRAGTTWLYECLREHPEIFLPETKELHYFDLNHEKGDEWYFQHFEGVSEKAIGEITPNYYQYPGAIEKAHALLPEAKFIFILREPKARAISQFALFKEKWGLTSIEQALEEKPEFADLSLQGKHLQRISSIVPKENLLVLFYEDLASSPLSFLSSVYRFLGVREVGSPSFLNKRVNKVLMPNAQQTLRNIGLGKLLDALKESKLAEPIKRVIGKLDSPQKQQVNLPDSFLRDLEEDINRIEQSLNVDLKHWN
jgi:hypothetical protein